jgi:hypothetical protein
MVSYRSASPARSRALMLGFLGSRLLKPAMVYLWFPKRKRAQTSYVNARILFRGFGDWTQQKQKGRLYCLPFQTGGDEGDRTPDLSIANP